MNCKTYFLLLLVILLGCNSDQRKQQVETVLEVNGYFHDYSIDETLVSMLSKLNCVIQETGYRFSILSEFAPKDTLQILVIPFRSTLEITSSGFSDLNNRLVFVNPARIRSFVAQHSLSDSTNINGYLGIVLLHELGHLVTGLSSGIEQEVLQSELGEQLMPELEPQIITIQKQNELHIDSLAVSWIKKAINNTQPGCFDIALDVQLSVNSGEFTLFGLRTIQNFGNEQGKVLIDPTNAHPNFELRFAFMNYYFTESSERKQMIDDYLYDRVQGALERQLADPRIFQGMDK